MLKPEALDHLNDFALALLDGDEHDDVHRMAGDRMRQLLDEIAKLRRVADAAGKGMACAEVHDICPNCDLELALMAWRGES